MKKLWPLLIIIPLLLSFICTVPLMAEEEEAWKVKIGEETYLITKMEETGLRYIPETTDLNVLSDTMTAAVRVNPVSLPDYIGTQIPFWGGVLVRFALTAKPIVVFKEDTYAGLEITIYEQPKWVVTWGKVYEIEDGELAEQPSFIGIETRELPMLSDLAEIFQKIRLGGMYLDKKFWAYLSYELTEE